MIARLLATGVLVAVGIACMDGGDRIIRLRNPALLGSSLLILGILNMLAQ